MEYVNFLQNIEQKLSSLTKRQGKVASFILDRPIDAAFSTIEELATRMCVSTTTIVRLANSLGYPTYSDFQRNLQDFIIRLSSPALKYEINISSLTEGDGLINKIVALQINNIKSAVNNINESTIDHAVAILKKASKIRVSGSRSSFSVAHFLAFTLKRVMLNVEFVPLDDFAAESLIGMGHDDVFISISMPRYIKKAVDLARYAKAKGITVLSITDTMESPLAKFSDIVFACESKSLDFHNSMCSSMVISEILITALFASLDANEIKDKLEEAETILSIMNVHYKS